MSLISEQLQNFLISDLAQIQPGASEQPCFLRKELISAQSEQLYKISHLRSRLDATRSFKTHMFLNTELISAQSEQFKKNSHLRSRSDSTRSFTTPFKK